MNYFEGIDIPHRRIESWKYTNPGKFARSYKGSNDAVETDHSFEGCETLIFSNGNLVKDDLALAEKTETNSSIHKFSEDFLSKLPSLSEFKLNIDKTLDKPLVIIHTNPTQDLYSKVKLDVECAKGISAHIVEIFESKDDSFTCVETNR